MASFNEPRSKPKRNRAPRRELVACGIARQTSFPVRGGLSVRVKFHTGPVSMAPPLTATLQERVAAEHSYVRY